MGSVISATAPGPDTELIEQIRAGLVDASDATKAPNMQRYMKSAMPYLGVSMPVMRRITKACERARPPASEEQVSATVAQLWRTAGYREERYAAIELLKTPTATRLRDLDQTELLEEMIRSGAWWDFVDNLSQVVGALLADHRLTITPLMQRWSTDEDRWIRRTSVICQLSHKDRTDLDLLTAAIDANLSDPDFFLRKAIGWALRQYARTDPDWVRRFVAARADRLSALSRREALKHL